MLRASGALLLGSSAFSAGCAALRPGAARSHRLLLDGEAPVALTTPADLPAGEARFVEEALGPALLRLKAFGFFLREGVELRVHRDARSFQAATGRSSPWLRAWAGYATVDLLPPSTWSDAEWPAPVERLAHELCHCAMFQRFGSARAAAQAAIPFFFSEGTASVVAGQEARRMPLVDLARRSAGSCPLEEGWVRHDHLVAYGAAHHAVAFLARRFGEDCMARVVDEAARQGGRGCVEEALERITKLSPCGLWTLVAGPAIGGPARWTRGDRWSMVRRTSRAPGPSSEAP